MHFKVSAVLPIDARSFLIERDSAAFRALVARTQNLGALEIRKGWTDGDVQVFKLVTQPDIDHFVPKRLQKYMPGNLEYTDIIRYDPAALKAPPFTLQIHSVPPVFAKKTIIECSLTIEEVDESHCRQTLEGDVNINVMGVGFIAERVICSSLRDVYSGIPSIVERWNVFRDEVMKQPHGRERLFEGRPPLKEDWVSEQVSQVMRAPYCSHSEADSTSAPHLQQQTPHADTGISSGAATATGSGRQDGAVRQDGGAGQTDSASQAAAALPSAAAGATADGATGVNSQQQHVSSPLQGHQQARDHLQPPATDEQRPSLAQADKGQYSVEGAQEKSFAVFEGETFFTPDDIPGGVDDATAASLRADQQEAAEWFRRNSQGAHQQGAAPVPATASEEDQSRNWWTQESSHVINAEPWPADTSAGPGAAGYHVMRSNISNAHNLSDWSDFWAQLHVAQQHPAPAAAHRLTGLYGMAVERGLDRPTSDPCMGAVAVISTARGGLAAAVPASEGGAAGPPWSGIGHMTPKPRTQSRRRSGKSVAFESPLVNGVHEARPLESEVDSEDSVQSSKFCFCIPRPGKPRFQYQ